MKLAYRISRLISRRQAQVLPKLVANFDEAYYLHWYHDVHGFPGGPLEHFLRYGWMEGRDPNAWFSTRGYLTRNEDVRLRGGNPLIHFLQFGLAEGRVGWQKDPNAPPFRSTHSELPKQRLAAPISKRNR